MFHWMWNIKREIQASEASIENLLLHNGSTNMKMNLFAWQSTKVEQLQQVKHKLGQPLQAAHEVQHFKHFTGNNKNNSSTCTYTYVQHTNTCIYIWICISRWMGLWPCLFNSTGRQLAQRTEVTPFRGREATGARVGFGDGVGGIRSFDLPTRG